MFLERAFIDPLGLPDRPFYRWERFTFHFLLGVRYEKFLYQSLNGVTMFLFNTAKVRETGGIRLKRGNNNGENFSVICYTEWERFLLEAYSDNFSWFDYASKQMSKISPGVTWNNFNCKNFRKLFLLFESEMMYNCTYN